MSVEVLMPALSPTMEEGTLAKWHVKAGDTVKSGDVIAEIETDKATMEVEAVDEGVLGKIVVPEGTANVKVNDVIALLLGEGEDKAALSGGQGAPAKAPPAAPAPATTAPKAAAPAAAPSAPPPAPAARSSNGADPAEHGDRVFASPLARRMAANAGLDLAALHGSGPHGRIVKADIEAALRGGAPAPTPARPQPAAAPAPAAARAPTPTPAPAPGVGPAFDLVPTTTMRKVIARRLSEAQQIPHFFLTVDCHVDPLLKVRADLNTRGEKDGFKLSVNDFVIKAAALALRRMPTVNASWSDDGILQYRSVDVSVAVALPAGLITPIVHNADQKGLATISNEMKDLAARARDGKLKPEEFQGGTFSISNLGMYGMREFTAILNPPQSCILAVAAGIQQAVVRDGALAVATVMRCTISCDHRVIDGATAAQFMNAFKKYVESPVTMLL